MTIHGRVTTTYAQKHTKELICQINIYVKQKYIHTYAQNYVQNHIQTMYKRMNMLNKHLCQEENNFYCKNISFSNYEEKSLYLQALQHGIEPIYRPRVSRKIPYKPKSRIKTIINDHNFNIRGNLYLVNRNIEEICNAISKNPNLHPLEAINFVDLPKACVCRFTKRQKEAFYLFAEIVLGRFTQMQTMNFELLKLIREEAIRKVCQLYPEHNCRVYIQRVLLVVDKRFSDSHALKEYADEKTARIEYAYSKQFDIDKRKSNELITDEEIEHCRVTTIGVNQKLFSHIFNFALPYNKDYLIITHEHIHVHNRFIDCDRYLSLHLNL